MPRRRIGQRTSKVERIPTKMGRIAVLAPLSASKPHRNAENAWTESGNVGSTIAMQRMTMIMKAYDAITCLGPNLD